MIRIMWVKKNLYFRNLLLIICCITINSFLFNASGQELTTITVRRTEIDSVLTNPGKGFNTFQCFNGDYAGNAKTGYPGVGGGKVPNCLGHPVPSCKYSNDWSSINYPISTTAYFRLLWNFFEPQEGEYNIQIGIVNPETQKPEVNLAIKDRTPDGWYRLGKIKIE